MCGKPQLHGKFETTGFISYGNISKAGVALNCGRSPKFGVPFSICVMAEASNSVRSVGSASTIIKSHQKTQTFVSFGVIL